MTFLKFQKCAANQVCQAADTICHPYLVKIGKLFYLFLILQMLSVQRIHLDPSIGYFSLEQKKLNFI